MGQIDWFTYCVNLYGPYQGHETDRHRWGYDYDALRLTILEAGFMNVQPYDWAPVDGMECPRDWWILGVRGVK